MSEEKGLSTEFAPAYKIEKGPKNIKIQIGKTYELTDGYGTKKVKIISIRKLNNEVVIYYSYNKKGTSSSVFNNDTEVQQSVTLETFMAQCLEYGQVDSIDLLYPGDKDEDYYKNKEQIN